MKKLVLYALVCFWSSFQLFATPPDEGMYPMSELQRLNLQKLGFMLSANEIFNPNGVSLTDALVRIGGCTGSFVSPQGLIITNHHCAFGAVAAASTVEKDYITNGFFAKALNQEIPAKGLVVRITKSYLDVSNEVLKGTAEETDPLKKVALIRSNMQEIEKREKAANPNLLIEISEMFQGKAYTLFRYQEIKDIRLVYVPPRNIGEFGGETDNWVWPRHTGDFSFARAYVAPDGSPAAYDEKNVPFEPKNYLRVNPNGVEEEDFVFILGYPGRTFRHQPSNYLEYNRDVQMPIIVKQYDWMIDKMKEIGETNDSMKIVYASRMKSLANTTKNYKGKLQGFRRIDIIGDKKLEEDAMRKFIASTPALTAKYGSVFSDIDKVYADMNATAQRDWLVRLLLSNSGYLAIASQADKVLTRVPSEADAKKKYWEENMAGIMSSFEGTFKANNRTFEYDYLKMMLTDALNLPANQRIEAVDKRFKTEADVIAYLDRLFNASSFKSVTHFKKDLAIRKDRFLDGSREDWFVFAKELNALNSDFGERSKMQQAKLTGVLPLYLEAKMEMNPTNFIPDANSTLRLTSGFVRGYSPQDGEYQMPFTSIGGIIEKHKTGNPDFGMPPQIDSLHSNKEFGNYVKKDMEDVPVGLLYNLDTTGGNSGSPVMNNRGELVGVNFDRAFTATINDFAWNEKYSRSIAVDIRYVLWVLEKFAGANNLIQEMGVK